MKILFLASRLPFPPDRGDRVRAFHFLRTLSSDHEIDLAALAETPIRDEERRALEAYCRRVEVVPLTKSRSVLNALAGLPSALPLQVSYYRDRRYASLVSRLAKESRYDLVFSHLFRVFPYARLAGAAIRLVDLTDVVSREVAASAPYRALSMRVVYKMEGARIRRYERRICREADEVWVISEAEKEILVAERPTARIEVVPNGLDPGLAAAESPSFDRYDIGFLGHLDVYHNLDGIRFFCTQVFPKIRRAVPGARFRVAGQGGPPALVDLMKGEGTEIVGFVPDVGEFLRGISLFVAPLRFAAGTQNKVIQAMAAGVPTIASPEVARGLGGAPGIGTVVARTADEWVEAAVRLLRDKSEARRIGDGGRRFARERFTWETARARMRAIEDSGAG